MDWLDALAVQGTLKESSPTPQFKSINSSALSFLYSPTLTYMTTGKTIALTKWTFVGKVMSLLLNMLSRLVITFLLRSKCLLIWGTDIKKIATICVWEHFVYVLSRSSKVPSLIFSHLNNFEFIFLCSKIPGDGDCSHDNKRCLLLGRKVMTNLDSILKSREITLLKKVRLVKDMVFQ